MTKIFAALMLLTSFNVAHAGTKLICARDKDYIEKGGNVSLEDRINKEIDGLEKSGKPVEIVGIHVAKSAATVEVNRAFGNETVCVAVKY